jgi:hypothetical protein
MAPEVGDAAELYDGLAADIHSMGCVLFTLYALKVRALSGRLFRKSAWLAANGYFAIAGLNCGGCYLSR